MKRYRIIITGLLLLLCVSSVHAGQPSDLPDDLALTTLDGKALDPVALRSRPLVLIVGATWCPECRREAAEAQKTYLEYEARGVMFLWVFGASRDADIRDFLAAYKITFPAALDNGIAERLGVRVIPQTLFYAKGGKFVKKIIGPASHGELVSNIDKIIGK
jgi:cytochrome c biogenesis protein CcmG/thiol:disulfide interchange protein DsbE